jgi:hypothetical protein
MANDYTFRFGAIDTRLNTASMINHIADTELHFRVAIDDQQLTYWSGGSVKPQVADMVDLALAVHIADRFSSQVQGRPTSIHIHLPVRRPELLNSPPILHALKDALYWYTENFWSFSFEKRDSLPRPTERQASFIPMLRQASHIEVALWSGGLDSFAGLWQRQLRQPDTHYVLFGTGPNRIIEHRQRRLAHRFKEITAAPISLVQVPLRLQTPMRVHRNRYQRSRGFVFLLLGSVCAHLERQSTLHIYENGIGALNLPFRPAEVGVDHSRAVHPISFLKMAALVSNLLDSAFTFVNPFLFHTKAEICAPLRGTPAEAIVQTTISCDARPRRRGLPIQCGRCSSCILRRQALTATGMRDQTPYAYGDLAGPDNRFAYELMLEQRDVLQASLATPEPWSTLRRRYPVLEKTVTRMARASETSSAQLAGQLISLYKRYTREWDQAQPLLEVE